MNIRRKLKLLSILHYIITVITELEFYPWIFDPLTRGILTSLSISWLEMGGQNTMGVQFSIQGGSVFNKGVQYTMDENWPRGQFTIGFKIPYDTGTSKTDILWQIILIYHDKKTDVLWQKYSYTVTNKTDILWQIIFIYRDK